MRTVSLKLRWSWRDLRARWLQVAAIALIIGLGSGTYSGLSSVSRWRQASYDASYERLGIYDLHLAFARGAHVDAARAVATARDAARRAGAPGAIVEPRLVERTQVDASRPGETVLVPGRLVGVDVAAGGPRVNGIEALAGRGLRPSDSGRMVGVLDEHFADSHDIPAAGSLRISGGRGLRHVGRGISPERFFPMGEGGSLFADLAVIYVPLATVQRIVGRPGRANDLVVRLPAGSAAPARARALAAVEAAIRRDFPDAGFTATARADDPVLRMLYDDIDADQRLYNVFALLVLLGAAFAAFNLTTRIVEAQRREIGIGMALGVPPRTLAVRPILVGVQVALLGTAFGVVVGLLLGDALRSLLASEQPLPAWLTSFQPWVFAKGAALGFGLPLAATLWPVTRAVRVAPVDAIRTGHRAVRLRRRSRLASLLARLPVPGSSVTLMPLRNVARSPRRTLLTAAGIAAAITTLVGVLGMLDSMVATIDRGDREIVGSAPQRLTVDLDFTTVGSPPLRSMESSPLVRAVEPRLNVGGALDPGPHQVEVLLSGIDFRSPVWRPTAVRGSLRTDVAGLVIAEKAAADLGVDAGDTVALRHPVRSGTGYRFVESEMPVLAIHPNPYRFVAYFHLPQAGFMDLEGIVNGAQIDPRPGVRAEAVQRAFFDRPGIVSVEPVTAAADAIRDRIGESLGFLRIIEAMVLLLALLIAFNSTAITMDERARENATMLAFGLPVRSVLGVAVKESVVVGLLGTVGGILLGRVLLHWLVNVLIADTIPEVGVEVFLSLGTITTALGLGVLAVAVAPTLTLRRLRRMDVPSTLRVME